MAGGRPPKYTSVDELQSLVDGYFAECEIADPKRIPTAAGIALHLGLSRQGMWEYGKKDQFSDTIKEAKQRVEAAWEEAMLKGGGGAIFWMKNNAGYRDKHEVEEKSEQEITYKWAE